MQKLLIENQYLGPLRYYATLIAFDIVVIEAKEHFTKRTYRNRCHLAGPNGVQVLSIPLEKDKKRIAIDEVKIVYDQDWKKNHWHTIVSIYNRSPFFEYYKEDFEIIYQKQHVLLFDFLNDLNELIFEILEIKPAIEFSTEYCKMGSFIDKRLHILPNEALSISDEHYSEINYYQVFQEKNAFKPEMSILDLIFCEGPNASYLLKSSYSI